MFFFFIASLWRFSFIVDYSFFWCEGDFMHWQRWLHRWWQSPFKPTARPFGYNRYSGGSILLSKVRAKTFLALQAAPPFRPKHFAKKEGVGGRPPGSLSLVRYCLSTFSYSFHHLNSKYFRYCEKHIPHVKLMRRVRTVFYWSVVAFWPIFFTRKVWLYTRQWFLNKTGKTGKSVICIVPKPTVSVTRPMLLAQNTTVHWTLRSDGCRDLW